MCRLYQNDQGYGPFLPIKPENSQVRFYSSDGNRDGIIDYDYSSNAVHIVEAAVKIWFGKSGCIIFIDLSYV